MLSLPTLQYISPRPTSSHHVAKPSDVFLIQQLKFTFKYRHIPAKQTYTKTHPAKQQESSRPTRYQKHSIQSKQERYTCNKFGCG